MDTDVKRYSEQDMLLVKTESIFNSKILSLEHKIDNLNTNITLSLEKIDASNSLLKEHLSNPDLHQCEKHERDINLAHSKIRKFQEVADDTLERVTEIETKEKELQDKIAGVKWFVATVVLILGIAGGLIKWVLEIVNFK